MGWLSSHQWNSKKEMADYLLSPEYNKLSPGGCYKPIDSCFKTHGRYGGTLWVVFEKFDSNGISTNMRFIFCGLIAYFKVHGCYGYKDLEESCGPVEKDCPLRFFELVPTPPNEWAKEWREKVREYHAKKPSLKKLGVKVGHTYRLIGARGLDRVEIISIRPLRGSTIGGIYKIPLKMIGEEIKEPEAESWQTNILENP